MEKIKSFIVKTFVLLINAVLVVGGVFFIKNQNDKNKGNQMIEPAVSNEDVNIAEDNPVNKNVVEEVQPVISNVPGSNVPTDSAAVKSTPTSTPTAPTAVPKKTTKTS